jgi:hypothetical protein
MSIYIRNDGMEYEIIDTYCAKYTLSTCRHIGESTLYICSAGVHKRNLDNMQAIRPRIVPILQGDQSSQFTEDVLSFKARHLY